jgi:two-component system, NtrC family, sensor kinase
MVHNDITGPPPTEEGFRTEERLRFLSSAVEQCPVSIVITDTCGRIVYVNRKTTEITGYTFEELKGQNPRILKSGETPPEAYKQLWETIQAGEWRGTFHNRRKNGELFWEAATISPLRNAQGMPTHFLAIKEDITERKAMEAALRTSEERFRIAAENASDLIWELDLDTRQVQLHGPVEALPGMNREPIDGRFENWIRTVHPDDVCIVLEMIQTHAGRRPSHPYEYRRILPDGSMRYWVDRGTTLLDESGRPHKWIGVSSDITDRKLAVEALAKSEQLHRKIVETAAEGIWMTDANSTVTFVNPQVLETLAMNSEDLLGHPIFEFIARDDYPEIELMRGALRKGRKVSTEVRLNRKDRSVVWASVSACPLFRPDGEFSGALGMFTDITERKRSEDELRDSRERFRIVAEGVADVIYEVDLESGRLQILGGSDPLHLNLPTREAFAKLVHPDDLPGFEAANRDQIENGGHSSNEFRVVIPGLGVRYLRDDGFVLRDNTGKPIKRLGISKDVTEIRAAERANAELAAIVENVDAAVISKDTSGRVLTWNTGAENIYGYTAEEMIGGDLARLLPVGRESEEAAILERVCRGERVHHLETARLTKSGALIDVLLTISPIRDREGTVAGAAHVAWDISQLKMLQRQLAQAQKLESIGQLAAGIAHEINTPIQYIGDNAKFLEDSFSEIIGALQAKRPPHEVDLEYLGAEIPKAIGQLREGVERVSRIIRAMKEFSHPGPLDLIAANINAAIESTVVVSRNEWKSVAELTTDLDPDLPPVPCVVGEFNQVILNLIVNAAHAIADVPGESRNPGSIHISTRKAGAFAEVRVTDNGCGIPESIRSRIFDPFFTTKEVGRGTGQGLAIAHAVIVQKHRGTLTLETEAGRGTTFLIRLPLGADSSEPQRRQNP